MLVLTRGLPASGKTTFARSWVAENPGKRVRVNRDSLRRALAATSDGDATPFNVNEDAVTCAQRALVRDLLASGRDVIVDDTNLRASTAKSLMKLAVEQGVDYRVVDFLDVPLEVCLERNRDRPTADRIPDDAIERMYGKFLRGKKGKLPVPELASPVIEKPEPYVAAPGTPPAVLVDVDGTVALMCGRGPFDWGRVGEDSPNEPVIAAVRAMAAAGYTVVVMSGRQDVCREETTSWLKQFLGVPFEGPFMRKADDSRSDAVVKLELFDAHVRDRFDVRLVFDDRQKVVDMWRSLGLVCVQVAPGDF